VAEADGCIVVLHQTEQVTSEERIGSLAEAVLEALKGCPEAEEKVGWHLLLLNA
jgi:hypothetical protein